MHILSVGVPLPGPAVDNYTFASAPTFFDYDALVIDPAAVSTLIEEVAAGSTAHTVRSGEHVVLGASGPGAIGLADLLRDRRGETARLLARGGLVVCYAQPNATYEALPGSDRYCWLPPPPGVAYDHSFLRRGSGTQIEVADQEHAFAPFIDRVGGKLTYQAYFVDDSTGTVFARSAGGAAVGVELGVGAGRVVFVPPPARPPSGDERYAYSNALQDAIRQTLRLAAEGAPPGWLDEYTLPGLSERLSARDDARARVAEAQQALSRAEEAARELDRYRRLLWQEGKYGLEQVMREALALIGFEITPNSLDRPATLSSRESPAEALLEVDAAVQAVGLAGHERLRRRLDLATSRGGPRRGLLLINGYRTLPPAKRPAQYHDDLRAAAERLGYCIATTEQLFHAVRAALEGHDATVQSFRERLLTAHGVLGED